MRVAVLTITVPVMLGMCGFSLGCVEPVQPAGAAAAVYTPHPVPVIPQPARPVWNGCAPGTERLYGEAVPVYQVLYAYHGGFLQSHYTLCDNGTFELAFESGRFPPFDYIGKYAQSDSDVAFNFVDSDLAGPWTATARLGGDMMIVEYNSVMYMADFVNGPYVRQRVP
jgi:hypothetical protein